MKSNNLILAIIITLGIISCKDKKGDNEPSISYADLATKINNARDGDTVNIPAGIITFDAGISVSKNINIIGAGIDKTIFVSNITNANMEALAVKGNNAGSFRISGITFKGKAVANMSRMLYITGNCKNFRIDHCKFADGYGPQSISVFGLTYGVIDHCEFVNDAMESVNVMDGNTGDSAWIKNDPLGTGRAVYIEDCAFSWTFKMNAMAVASNLDSRYVFRHNSVSHTGESSYPLLDAHGNINITNGRGSYSVEAYENTFYSNSGTYYGFYLRGGRGVIFNNTITGNVGLPFCFTEYRSWTTKTAYQTQYPGRRLYPHWDELQDEIDFTNSNPTLEADSDYCDNVYPAPDQINNYYVWNNTYNGAIISPTVRDRGTDQAHIKKDRDYFEKTMPGYTPYVYPHPLVK
jgi:hypothetical protein